MELTFARFTSKLYTWSVHPIVGGGVIAAHFWFIWQISVTDWIHYGILSISYLATLGVIEVLFFLSALRWHKRKTIPVEIDILFYMFFMMMIVGGIIALMESGIPLMPAGTLLVLLSWVFLFHSHNKGASYWTETILNVKEQHSVYSCIFTLVKPDPNPGFQYPEKWVLKQLNFGIFVQGITALVLGVKWIF